MTDTQPKDSVGGVEVSKESCEIHTLPRIQPVSSASSSMAPGIQRQIVIPPNPEAKTAAVYSDNNMLSTTSAATSSQDQEDPFSLSQHKRSELDKKALRADYPRGKPRHLKKYYTRQNDLIESYLGSANEEAAEDLDMGL